jgi:hypothetical protein
VRAGAAHHGDDRDLRVRRGLELRVALDRLAHRDDDRVDLALDQVVELLACFGRLPSELRICTFQPLAVAASFAAFATRACVSDDIWNATMPTSNARPGLRARQTPQR